MKTFIKQIILFLVLTVLFIETISAILVYTELYLISYPGKEIYHVIEKSKKKNKSRKLLIGDSVARQLFHYKEEHKGFNSLASNQSISMAGQYFLVNNYLKAGNEIDTLILLFTPSTFKNNLDQNYTYHYFIKPFFTSEYSPLFTKTVNEQIDKIHYHDFAHLPHIQATTWAPDFECTDTLDYTFLSPISAEYLSKIKDLSIAHHFIIALLPTPTNINKKELIEKIDINELLPSHLEKEFDIYFEQITYLDSTHFVDATHLVHPETYSANYILKLNK